jgi:putative RNA 2'-phosphotransferase
MNLTELSKAISYALRHAPWEYELELDEEGWVSLDELLAALKAEPAFAAVALQHIQETLERADKARHEISGGRIRALYGHSVPGKLRRRRGAPPDVLYHGTVRAALPSIRAKGLRPMKRQYVHLSTDADTARIVGARKGRDVHVLTVRAGRAAAQGVPFYEGNGQVWLADHVPPEWLIFP